MTTPLPVGELVPATNMEAVQALAPEARELAVTHMLAEARSWLAHAVETTDPHSIAEFKAQMATVAEATKQLNLSREIQQDALEMVRRAERGVGQAIRKGQTEGTIRGVGDDSRTDLVDRNDYVPLVPPSDIATKNELYGNGVGILAMADGVSDEQFDDAIDAAKDEGNLSRANVVRKVRGVQCGTVETREMRAKKIREMAAAGHDRHAISKAVGVGVEAVLNIARDFEIEIPADTYTLRKKRAKSPELLDRAVATLEAVSRSITHINPSDLDPAEAWEQIDSLTRSLNAIRKAANQIKESL